MSRIGIRVSPSLSKKMSKDLEKGFILGYETELGQTLENIFDRLDNDDHETWRIVWNSQTGKLQELIIIDINGTGMTESEILQRPLKDGDMIDIHMIFSAG